MSGSAFPAFTGELGVVGLFDVSQLLQLNRATGCLTVTRDGERGYLYFRDGRIVNAIDDERCEGEDAACRVLGWRTGRFEFRAGPPGCASAIEGGTESLLLEAARRIDESADAGDGGHETEKLRQHRGAMSALREAFLDLERESRPDANLPLEEREPEFETLLAALGGPEDRLLLRPNEPALLWSGSGWTSIGAPTVPATLARWRTRLLPESAGAGDTILVHDGGRVLAATAFGSGASECLWVTPAGLEPPNLDAWRGPHERLAEMLERPRALMVVGATTPAATRTLFHAVVSFASRRRTGLLLLVGDDRLYRHPDDFGVVMPVTVVEAAGRIRQLRPTAVACDAGTLSSARTFRAASSAPLIVVATTAASEETLLSSWLASLPRAARIASLLEAVPLGLVFAEDEAGDAHGPSFRVRLVARGTASMKSPVPSGPSESAPRRSR